MSKQKARILVVEDEGTIRDALALALDDEGYAVQAEPDGRSLEAVAERFRPDLAILDVRLPTGPDGYEMARILRKAHDVSLLFVTAADALEDRLAGFDAGGDDYVVKPFSMPELLARVQALLRRAGRLSSAAMQVGDIVIDEGARTVVRNGELLHLTTTEYELLTVLARHPGRVLSKVQLLAQVWGYDAYDTNLVEVHASMLRRKLEAHGPRVIQTVRGAGYVFRA